MMKKASPVLTVLRLRADIVARLGEYQSTTGISKTFAVEKAVEEYLDKVTGKTEAQERLVAPTSESRILRPIQFVIRFPVCSELHTFRSVIGMTTTYIDAIIRRYGLDTFTQKVLSYQFFGPHSTRVVFFMDEKSLFGDRHRTWNNGLCFQMNYSAARLMAICDGLQILFPDVRLELQYAD